MLFGRRIGFSGTPSDLLPLDLGRCGYELGSDGKMLHVLTDPEVVDVQIARAGWTVKSLLRHVAYAEPRLNALIDTGALITGMSNKSVARYLLANGLGRWCEGARGSHPSRLPLSLTPLFIHTWHDDTWYDDTWQVWSSLTRTTRR